MPLALRHLTIGAAAAVSLFDSVPAFEFKPKNEDDDDDDDSKKKKKGDKKEKSKAKTCPSVEFTLGKNDKDIKKKPTLKVTKALKEGNWRFFMPKEKYDSKELKDLDIIENCAVFAGAEMPEGTKAKGWMCLLDGGRETPREGLGFEGTTNGQKPGKKDANVMNKKKAIKDLKSTYMGFAVACDPEKKKIEEKVRLSDNVEVSIDKDDKKKKGKVEVSFEQDEPGYDLNEPGYLDDKKVGVKEASSGILMYAVYALIACCVIGGLGALVFMMMGKKKNTYTDVEAGWQQPDNSDDDDDEEKPLVKED